MDNFKAFIKTHLIKISIILFLLITIIFVVIFYKPYYFENNPKKLESLAQEYIAQINYKDAARTYMKLAELEPSSMNEFNVGLALLRNKEYHNALPYIKKALKMDAKNPYAIAALAEYYFALEDSEKGLKEVNASIAIKPTALAYFNLGKFYFKVQSTDNAYIFLTKSVELDKNQIEIYPYLAEVYTNKGYFVPAFDAYEHYYSEKSRADGAIFFLISDEADYVRKKMRSLRDMAGEL